MADTLVPPRMMTELHERCGSERKQLLQLPSGTHNETWTLQGYYHSLAVFLQNCRLQSMEHPQHPVINNNIQQNIEYTVYNVQNI